MSRSVGSKIVYQLRRPIFISRLRGKTRSSAGYGIPGIPVMEEKISKIEEFASKMRTHSFYFSDYIHIDVLNPYTKIHPCIIYSFVRITE